MKRTLFLLFMFGCGSDAAPDAALQVRVPTDRQLFQSITSFALRAERDDRVLAQQTTPANGSTLSLGGVPFGQRTVFTLDGITSAGDLVARGSSCPMDFEPHGDPIVIYFSPVNFFAPTAGAPHETRMFPIAFALGTGEIVIAGGEDTNAVPVASAEAFSAPTGNFAVLGSPLTTPRSHAEIVDVPGVGALVVGGHAANEAPADVYDVSSQAFKPLTNLLLTAHSGHRLITQANGHILIIGGLTVSGTPTNQTVDVSFTAGVAQFMSGPALPTQRADHAAVVVVGTPVVFGGNTGAADLDEILLLKNGAFQHFPSPDPTMPPKMQNPRAGLTATALVDGSVLLVGGYADASGNCGAEVFNPVTQESACIPTAKSRIEHTTTLLPDGRVLVSGGKDLVTGEILKSVELYVPGVGFVAERPLGTARHGHVAVPLCDGTVLVTGGGLGAEIYNPPASN